MLVLTHDHAEDFALCDAALRCGHLGIDRADRVVGEVEAVPPGLLVEGHTEAEVDRIITPIGRPGSAGKEPAAIALGVAAELMRAFAAERVVAPVTIFRARALDTPDDPFAGGALRSSDDARAGGRRRGDRRAW